MAKSNTSKKFKVDTCRDAILKTLVYRSMFKYPVTFYQLATQLITSREFDAETIRKEVNKLIDQKKVKKSYKKYELEGEKYVNWKARFSNSEKLISKHKYVFDILAKIPWVKMIAVTGSAAAYNSEKSSDLDILIVAGKNRLWLTRGFVVTLLTLIGKQPRIDGEPDKLCTNIFIEENHMEWEKSKRNLYTATDIVLMQPIMQRDNTYLKFIKENKWVFDYYANFKTDFTGIETTGKHTSALINRLESTAMMAQMWYMEAKKTTEITTKYLIHFNKNDNFLSIGETYKKLLKDFKLS